VNPTYPDPIAGVPKGKKNTVGGSPNPLFNRKKKNEFEGKTFCKKGFVVGRKGQTSSRIF